MRLLQKFVDNAPRYCFSQIPNTFFGFLPNTSMNEKIHDLIKRILPYSKPFTVSVTKMIDYLEELGKKCDQYQLETLQIENLFNFPSLKEARFLVCKAIMLKIMHQLSKSIAYEAACISEEVYELRTSTFQFLIKKDEQKWLCSC
jgi:hypothetical protein